MRAILGVTPSTGVGIAACSIMRSQVLAAVILLALTGVACSDAGDGLSSRALRRSSPISGEPHDSEMDGANASDPGNPNATSAPRAPTTQGTAAKDFSVTLANVTPIV